MNKQSVLVKVVTGVVLVACLFLPWLPGAASISLPESQKEIPTTSGMLVEAGLLDFNFVSRDQVVGWLTLAERLTVGLLDREVSFADHSLFSHRSPFRSEFILSFLAYPLSAADMERFDLFAADPSAIIDSLAETSLTSGATSSPQLMPGWGRIGENSIGIMLAVGNAPVAQEVDFIWSVRGEVLQSTWVIYPAGDNPTVEVEELARLVDEEIMDRFIGTVFRPAGTYVPDLTTHIPTPLDVSLEPDVIGANLLLAALMMLPFAVAAETFTRLVGEREKQLRMKGNLPGPFRTWWQKVRGPTTPGTKKKTLPGSLLRLLLVMFFYGITFSLLDRTWKPFTLTGVVLFLDMLLAYGIVGIADDLFQWRVLRRWGDSAELSLRPTNILLAAGSTLASRLIPLVPGLMFGTPEALVVEEGRLSKTKRGRLLGISAITLLSIGFGLWGLTTLTTVLQHGDLPAGAINAIGGVEAFLLVIFAVALENTFVQMLGFPGGFGEALRKRNRWLWFVALIGVAFIFYHTLINPRGDLARALQEANTWVLFGAVGIFVLITFFWWAAAHLRKGKKFVEAETSKPRKKGKQAIPAWVWLAVNIVGIMIIGTLLLTRWEEPLPVIVPINAPVETQVLPSETVVPIDEPSQDISMRYQPPRRIDKLCIVPVNTADQEHYDATLWSGVRLVAAQFGGEAVSSDSGTVVDYSLAVNEFIQNDCDLILGNFAYQDGAFRSAAENNPDNHFWLWGGDLGGEVFSNLWQMESYLDQVTFLAGYLVAGVSESGKVGIIGEESFPVVRSYMDCAARGVSEYNRAHGAKVAVLGWDTETQQGIFNGDLFSPDLGTLIAEQLISGGVDAIVNLSGGGVGSTGFGVFETIQEHSGVYMVGVDIDWAWAFPEAAGVVLNSEIIHFERSIARAVDALVEGQFTSGIHGSTLESRELGLAPLGEAVRLVSPELMDEITALANASPPVSCEVGGTIDPAVLQYLPSQVMLPSLTPSLTHTPRPTATQDKGIFNPANGHWYKLIELPMSWHEAQTRCSIIGAHLATISNSSENGFVSQLVIFNTFIGATDEAVEGQWVWVTGEPWSYTNWDPWPPGEPNNCGGPGIDCTPEHYLTIYGNGLWNDIAQGDGSFICEWDE